MKVYLEEKDMPKDYKTTCKNCPFRGDEGLGCEERRMLDKDFICPLQSLADYTKQVRKEVVEFIDKCFEMQKYESIWINPDKTEFSCDVSYAYEWWGNFRKILLDQMQGG